MTDTDETRVSSVYSITIAAPIETVWAILVKTDEALPFFFGAVCDTENGLRKGVPMRMITPDRRFVSVVGEVLEFLPPHKYSHTFKFTNVDEPECIVTYELKEVPEGVEFSLIMENMPAGSKTEKSMVQGAKFIGENLKALAETGKPAFSGRMVTMLGPLMGMFTPAVCKAEHWPLEKGAQITEETNGNT